MRKFFFLGLFSLLLLTSCGSKEQAADSSDNAENTIYIISTNDMHASIDAFPELATLINEYERRGEVVVVDSGDRVTGNAYVDDAEPTGMPIIELMNRVGYDVVTLGNHEFDKGLDALKTMVAGSKFKWVCANVTTTEGKQLFDEYATLDIDGVKLGFAGIVDTDSDGYPLGNKSVYQGLKFENDIDCAKRITQKIATNHDFVVLLSHMGLTMDSRLAERSNKCDWIAGGHSHDRICERRGTMQISQNKKDLRFVTVAKLTINDGEITTAEYEQVDMSKIEEDSATRKLVDSIKLADPKLNEVIARANQAATRDGVANLSVESLMEYPYEGGFKPEVCFYHYGGVRLSSLAEGDVRRVEILNNDPFLSTIYIGAMTGAEIRKFILDKYNSGTAEKPDKESHYPYFRSNIPYQLVLGTEPAEAPDAKDIRWELDDERSYRVAMCNYIAESYIDKTLVANKLHDTKVLVREAMLRHITQFGDRGYTPNNNILQTEIKGE